MTSQPSSRRSAAVVTLSGDIGSGKTTIAAPLATAYGLRVVHTGGLVRAMAAARGEDLIAFMRYLELHPEIDRDLDQKQVEAAREGNVLLDSHIAAWAARESGMDALRIYLAVAHEEQVRRIVSRDACTREEAARVILQRETMLVGKMKLLYGFDLTDRANYDLVVDTTSLSRGAVHDAVFAAVEEYMHA